MSRLHLPSTHSPGSLAPEAVPNGATPRASFLRRAADGMNTIATYHKKVVQQKCQNLLSLGAGSGTTVYPWPTYFRTGHNTTGLRLWFGLVDTDYGAAVDPHAVFSIYDPTDDSLVTSKEFHYNGRKAPANAYEVANRSNVVTLLLGGLDSDTEYYLENQMVDGMRLLYLTAHEVADKHADDGVVGVVDPTKFVVDGPVYDEHVADILDAGAKHWRSGRCHYLTWNPDFGTSYVLPWTATTYTNLVDGTSTSYSAATPGFTIAAQYHGHAATGTSGPAAKLVVLARRTTGAGSLDVRLYDGTHSMAITGITTGGVGDWYTTIVNIPDSTTKWDLQAKVSAGTFEVNAVCLFAYDEATGAGALAEPAGAWEAVESTALPATRTAFHLQPLSTGTYAGGALLFGGQEDGGDGSYNYGGAYVSWTGGPTGTEGTCLAYDPSSDAWVSRASMNTPRSVFASCVLADGRILVSGGVIDSTGTPSNTAEIYDPTANTWTNVGNMVRSRVGHTLTLLPSGNVLAVGGVRTSGATSQSEIFNVGAGTWGSAANMPTIGGTQADVVEHDAFLYSTTKVVALNGHTSTGSPNYGRVFVYDIAGNSWTMGTSMPTPAAICGVAQLPSGKILVVGGNAAENNQSYHETWASRIYDPSADTWATGTDVDTGGASYEIWAPAMVTLADGRVLRFADSNADYRSWTYTETSAAWSDVIYTQQWDNLAGTPYGVFYTAEGVGRVGRTFCRLTSGDVLAVDQVSGNGAELFRVA